MREDYYEDEEDDSACSVDNYFDNITDFEKAGISDEGMKPGPKRKRKRKKKN